MHPLFEKADRLTNTAIGAAIEVHREMGPGLLESIYERCLTHELKLRGVATLKQQVVSIRYKDVCFEEELRFDLVADNCLLIEVKAVQAVLPIHKAQTLSYMKLLNLPVGLLFNFHSERLMDGLHRLLLPGANRPG
jgi:GxxExxY protein